MNSGSLIMALTSAMNWYIQDIHKKETIVMHVSMVEGEKGMAS